MISVDIIRLSWLQNLSTSCVILWSLKVSKTTIISGHDIIHDEIKCDPAATEFDSRIVSGILENIELVVSHIGEIATVKVPSQHGSPFHMKDIWNILNCAFSLQRKYRKRWMESGYYLVTSTDRYYIQIQKHKYHHLTMIDSSLDSEDYYHSVVKTSVTNNSLSQAYSYPDDHANHITNTVVSEHTLLLLTLKHKLHLVIKTLLSEYPNLHSPSLTPTPTPFPSHMELPQFKLAFFFIRNFSTHQCCSSN